MPPLACGCQDSNVVQRTTWAIDGGHATVSLELHDNGDLLDLHWCFTRTDQGVDTSGLTFRCPDEEGVGRDMALARRYVAWERARQQAQLLGLPELQAAAVGQEITWPGAGATVISEIPTGALMLFFGYPIKEAAMRLGVGTTKLKKICRERGIERWPFRKVRALQDSLDKGWTGTGGSGKPGSDHGNVSDSSSLSLSDLDLE